ncbi:hypothetical protein SDJN02_12216, partial [Cucurbita argyrosperma subsp. argyrosperma]
MERVGKFMFLNLAIVVSAHGIISYSRTVRKLDGPVSESAVKCIHTEMSSTESSLPNYGPFEN